MTDNAAVAVSWLEGLSRRGITASIRNGRLFLQPSNAYKQLTDDELITLRHHRESIKTLVADGYSPAPHAARPPVPNAASTAVQARTEPEPACPYCHQSHARCAEMKADRYTTWRDLHLLG